MSSVLTSRARTLLPLVLLLALGACHRESEGDFAWVGDIQPGRTVHVRNMNGPVRVHASPDGRVHVTGSRAWRGMRPERVTFAMRGGEGRGNGDLVFCAHWGSNGRCDDDNYRAGRGNWMSKLWSRRKPVAVTFDVALPAGVALDVSTVNGGVTVRDTDGRVELRTVNGTIDIESPSGEVEAKSVNGDVIARVGSLGEGSMTLETVNGSVSAQLPPMLDARLEARTVNGRIDSDFPLATSARTPRQLNATIGRGGPAELNLRTVNGSISLKRGV